MRDGGEGRWPGLALMGHTVELPAADKSTVVTPGTRKS